MNLQLNTSDLHHHPTSKLQKVLIDELVEVISRKMKHDDPRKFFEVLHSWILLHPQLHTTKSGSLVQANSLDHDVRRSPLVYAACNGIDRVITSRLTVSIRAALAGMDSFVMSPNLSRVYPILKSKVYLYSINVLRKCSSEMFSEMYREVIYDTSWFWTKETIKILQRVANERGLSS